MKLNWKYLLFDIAKVALPLVVVALLPDAPADQTIDVLLYALASALGIDSIKKTVNYLKTPTS